MRAQQEEHLSTTVEREDDRTPIKLASERRGGHGRGRRTWRRLCLYTRRPSGGGGPLGWEGATSPPFLVVVP